MANDVNKTFASLSGILLLSGFIAATQVGFGAVLATLFACYIMLVATNAISRGENRKRKK